MTKSAHVADLKSAGSNPLRVQVPSAAPRRSRRGTPCPPPSFEGGLPLCKIPVTAWRPRHPKCFTLTRRSRRGTPYPPPPSRGAFPLCRIPVTAWRPRHPKRFALTFWGHWSIQIRSLEEKDLRLLFLLFRRCGRLQGQAARNRSGGSLLAAHIQVSVDIRCGCKIAMP